ncbi:hypothetical protein V8C35DRAFT_294186 [Trichoderma chlorosporum]
MPPFIDRAHIHQAVDNQAIPALEAMAANDNLRSLYRFERDDPPPYVSSTESEELDDADLTPLPRGHPMPQELQVLMEQPLSQDEVDDIAYFMCDLPRPDDIYYKEAWREYHRVDSHPPGPRPEMFKNLNGSRRQGVIVRHLVKRRWQKLGIWNTSWGFAGRKVQPGDDWCRWTWWWQPVGAADDAQQVFLDSRELVARALRLRENLRRGEYAPSIPRSRLRPDATAAEAEAFLLSRPWFIFQLEVAEERTRYRRLSNDDQRRYPHSGRDQVIKWWRERGDWRDEYNSTSKVTSWKWRHESPSPEPEDLTVLDNLKGRSLDAVEEMEFTPSEIDELEVIDRPESEQPKGFWVIEKNDWSKHCPGEMVDLGAESRERHQKDREKVEKLKAEGRYVEPPKDPIIERLMNKYGRLFDPPPAAECEEILPEAQEASREVQEDEPRSQDDIDPCPPRTQRRLHQHHARGGLDSVQDQDQPVPPPPRRSSRIAAMKRRAEPLPEQTEPNKRLRRTVPNALGLATPDPAAAPVPRSARAKPVLGQHSPEEKPESRPRRGRGLARRENGQSISSAVQKRPARTIAKNGPRKNKNTRAEATIGGKRRGRPRQNRSR